MEKNINKILENIQIYNTRPIYSAQVSKVACRLVLEFEDGIEYRYPQDGSSAEMLPLNPFLFENGIQKIHVKIYPESFEPFIPEHAVANINFFYGSDIDFEFPQYMKIAEFSIPKEILKSKLVFFETVIELEVALPYRLRDQLDQSVDLTTLPNIENLVVKKYNQIREAFVNKDQRIYNELSYHYSLTFYNSIYHTSKKDIEEGESAQLLSMWDGLKNREIMPIENYEMKFYAQNKIVALWQSQTMYPMISVKGYIDNESSPNGVKDLHISDFIFLYLSNEGSELEIW